MSVTRIHEDPRVTKPYTETQWERIESLGQAIDRQLCRRGCAADDGRRTDLRLHRRHGRRRMADGGVGSHEAPVGRRTDVATLRAIRPRGRVALRSGKMVSGRAAAALGHALFLAPRRSSRCGEISTCWRETIATTATCRRCRTLCRATGPTAGGRAAHAWRPTRTCSTTCGRNAACRTM